MALSDEDRQRIYEEEKARDDARDEIARAKKAASDRIKQKKTGLGCLVLLGIAAVIAVIIGIGLLIGPAEAPIPFTTLEALITGGNERVVIIDPGHPEETVIELGEYLKDNEWPRGPINVNIWDDKEAFLAYQDCVLARRATETAEQWNEINEAPMCVRGLEMLDMHRLATAYRIGNGNEAVDYAGP
jgi:hypothetical protein